MIIITMRDESTRRVYVNAGVNEKDYEAIQMAQVIPDHFTALDPVEAQKLSHGRVLFEVLRQAASEAHREFGGDVITEFHQYPKP